MPVTSDRSTFDEVILDGMTLDQTILDEMIGRAVRHADTVADSLPRLRIRVRPHASGPVAALYRPMLCLVLQGAKQVVIGDRVLRYDPARYFISSLDLAGHGHVVEARADRPFVSLNLALDLEQVAALVPDVPAGGEASAPGFATAPVTRALLDPMCRLLRLLDEPNDAPVLAPLFEREILYRLLREPHGFALRQLARADSRMTQVRRAIAWIRAHRDEPLRIERLAEVAGMSAASLHRHFKVATGTSPLRYQKSLRLQQARRRMLANEDATRVGYAVGYRSLSQFSREYARMFGEPPARDARRARDALAR